MIGKPATGRGAWPLFVGTSGWSYDHWRGRFYPQGLDTREWFEFYAQQFCTVELNVTFYRLPFQNMIKSWHDRAPEGFVFAAKGSRVITHRKRLVRVRSDVRKFFDRIKGLGEHLGPILWQLPPGLHRDEKKLASFLKTLPKDYKHAVEFRHPSWYAPEVYEVLRAASAAIVNVSSLRMPENFERTADFVYLRFHGLEGGFAHDYTAAELKPWVEFAARCLKDGLRVYAYFNNDAEAHAPENALTFQRSVLRLVRAA